jgi:Glutaredoxin-like domain (DUF836)
MPDLSPTLVFLGREGCHLCDAARAELQRILEERVRGGRPRLSVRYLDVDADPTLHARYTDVVPVLRLDDAELPLAIRPDAIRRFLAQRVDARFA